MYGSFVLADWKQQEISWVPPTHKRHLRCNDCGHRGCGVGLGARSDSEFLLSILPRWRETRICISRIQIRYQKEAQTIMRPHVAHISCRAVSRTGGTGGPRCFVLSHRDRPRAFLKIMRCATRSDGWGPARRPGALMASLGPDLPRGPVSYRRSLNSCRRGISSSLLSLFLLHSLMFCLINVRCHV